ncbi:tubulin glycylase 3B-like [Culicoides brevitarsis]|uniref:tubulin glycylase 3B-like n=1 Tax=Culicoides brevitarsis TaxID=469753 RepID=UPI00307C356F
MVLLETNYMIRSRLTSRRRVLDNWDDNPSSSAAASMATMDWKNRLKYYRELVRKAIEERKVFRITSGATLIKLRAELLNRGFIEHVVIRPRSVYYGMNLKTLLDGARTGNEFENALISKLLGSYQPNFIWCPVGHYNVHATANEVNRIEFTGTDIITKLGICHHVKKMNKNMPKGTIVNIPRMYELTNEKDLQEFHKDFNWTLVVGLVMFLHDQANIERFFSTRHYQVEVSGVTYAIDCIENAVAAIEAGTRKHGEINETYFDTYQWRKIVQTHKAIVKQRGRIHGTTEMALNLGQRIRKLGLAIKYYWPQHRYDGYNNVWILKPGSANRGEGICVTDETRRMFRRIRNDDKHRKFVVQKYIERPFTIHQTKFDLRLYLLIVIDEHHYRGWTPKGIGDVKICSMPYTLDCFSDGRHITNTVVQEKYKQQTQSLPDQHMWSLTTLFEYLERQGHRDIYERKIYPMVKETLKQISKSVMDEVELCPVRFELFGVDVIIDHDFTPYLLEVNRGPSLQHFTSVSVLANNKLIEDLMKVVIDHNRDPSAPTGTFEVVYEENIEDVVIDTRIIEANARKQSTDMSWIKTLCSS